MRKFVKTAICLCLIILFSVFFTACKDHQQDTAKIKIGDIEYQTLTEAVQNAKSGDTIQIYDDVFDEKNIVIDKPLSIEGVLKEGQIKPKLYGSLTINSNGQTDSVTVKDIEIIHSGTIEEGENNDNSVGVNLIDGGLDLKSNTIMLDNKKTSNDQASGVIISRKINSENIMPIVIEGNNFGLYKISHKEPNGALIIKRNSTTLKNISLNEDEIYNKNSFSTQKEGNQMISIDFSTPTPTYSYLVTSSMQNLISSLENNQPVSYATYIIFPASTLNSSNDKPVIINEKTNLEINANQDADFKNSVFNLYGSMNIDGKVSNIKIIRYSPTSSVIINNPIENQNVDILNL